MASSISPDVMIIVGRRQAKHTRLARSVILKTGTKHLIPFLFKLFMIKSSSKLCDSVDHYCVQNSLGYGNDECTEHHNCPALCYGSVELSLSLLFFLFSLFWFTENYCTCLLRAHSYFHCVLFQKTIFSPSCEPRETFRKSQI